MTRRKGNGDVTIIESASYEQRVVAATIRQAVTDARSGDAMACQWLIHDAPEWLEWIATDTTDLPAVHERIMRLTGVGRTRSHTAI